MEYRYRDAGEMKDSGVEWIGMIPREWEVLKIKRIIDIINGNGFPERLQGKNNGDIPFYKVSDINFEGNYIFEAQNYVDLLEVNNNKWNIIKPNTIIIPKIGEALKKNHRKISTTNCLIDNNMCGIVSKGANVKYLLYLFKLVDMEWYLNPGAVPSINISQLKDDKSMLPEIVEQEKIGKFLDKKTSHFDSIISKKEALIEKLEEAKKSLISEVVTGKVKVVKSDAGYDLVKRSSDEMKDSGVEWLGEIPKDWEVKKVKHVASLKSGDSITSNNIKDEGIYPVYGGNGLRGYTSNYTHSGKYILIGRQGALCGNINYASNKFWASEHAVVVNPIIDANLTWLGELLRSMNLNQYSVSAAQPGLAVGMIENLYIPYTSIKIQNKIAAYIDEKIKNIEYTINKTKQQIEKLKEAKQSLISEAVTGKIEILD